MTTKRIEPGDPIHIDPGDRIILAAGVHPGGSLVLPEGATVEGEDGAILSGATPMNPTWIHEGNGVYYTSVNLNPGVLTCNGQQVGRMDDRKMAQGNSKTFGYSGLDLLRSPRNLTLPMEWGAGNAEFWETLYALWGYHNGRIYLRFRDGDNPDNMNVQIAPERDGISFRDGSVLSNVELQMFTTSCRLSGADGCVIEHCKIVNGLRRIRISGGSQDNIIRDNDIAMNFYGRRPGAWGGQSANGQMLYRFYKYFQGGSSSDDVSIAFLDAGGGNQIIYNYIHDGAIGFQHTNQRPGANFIHHNIFEHHNSVGCAIGRINLGTTIHDNLFGFNNIHIRGIRMETRGAWEVDIHDNRYYNPATTGRGVYWHTTSGKKNMSRDIVWDQYDEVFVGGETDIEDRNGTPGGTRRNITYRRNAEPIDVDVDVKEFFDVHDVGPRAEADDIGDPPEEDPSSNGEHEVPNIIDPPDIIIPSGPREWIIGEGERFQRIQQAEDTVSPGDTLLVKAGTYPEFSWNKSGEPNNPIYIKPAGDGMVEFHWSSNDQARFNGSHIYVDGGPDKLISFRNALESVVRVTGADVFLRRIHIRDAGIDNPRADWTNLLLRGSGCKVYGCEIYGAHGQGIYVAHSHTWDGPQQGSEIKWCSIHDNGGSGIQYNPHPLNDRYDDWRLVGEHLVFENWIEHCGYNYDKSGIVIVPRDPNDLEGKITIEGNTVKRCRSTAGDPGHDNSQQGIKIRPCAAEVHLLRNEVYDCEVGVMIPNQDTKIWYLDMHVHDNDVDQAIGGRVQFQNDTVMPPPEPTPEPEPKKPIVVNDGKYEVTIEEL
jgi:hypothetical protein